MNRRSSSNANRVGWTAIWLAFFASVNCVALAAAPETKALESKAPGLERMPEGWEVVREIAVTPAQLDQFSKRLNVELAALFNTFLRRGGQELQINTLSTTDQANAVRLKQTLQRGKSNPRWVVQNGKQVYEFVVQRSPQARLAVEARYVFPIQPHQKSYRVEFTAAPILRERDGIGPGDRNRLFNLLLQRSRSGGEAASAIADLSRHFDFASEISLAADLQQAIAVQWSSPDAAAAAKPGEHELATLKIERSERVHGLPIIRLAADVSIDLSRPRAADPMIDRRIYLAANSRFPAEAPEIRRIVQDLVDPADAESAKLRKLLDWFADANHLRYDGLVGSRYGALKTLDQRFGRCWDYSDLFVTMARRSGLPCRQVYGWVFESEGHVWCDVLVDGRWRMVDPTTATECGSDYLPFCTSSSGEFPLLYASDVTITEVKPRAPK